MAWATALSIPTPSVTALPSGSAGHLLLRADFEPVFSTPAASMAWCPNGSEASQSQGQSWEGTQLARGKQRVLEIWSPRAASSGQMQRLTVLMPALPDVPRGMRLSPLRWLDPCVGH